MDQGKMAMAGSDIALMPSRKAGDLKSLMMFKY
jgi:hypothetical protein